ncbi:hypothetical protein HHK36_011008 [Tetracentron sinense]|uniref:Uncharacterized protein n=1 Tax=Tetracentron sinense TaxID=13715 RepID=A0A835CZN6_TETSI|nr:hypothetical protein HHK36_033295 [Tetracentron sinense]KAF8402916.1 hypothetical protein HHK36_011008 [Tetracentron sinense]
MSSIGLVDLLLFHTLERKLFNRLVGHMGKESRFAKMAIALWLVMEEIGYYDLIRTIFSRDERTVEALFNEAVACLNCIGPNAIVPTGVNDTPILAGLFGEPISRRFFYYNRHFVLNRVTHVMNTVCNDIFGETAAIEIDDLTKHPVGISSSTEGITCSLANSSDHAESSIQGSLGNSSLNPQARPFSPGELAPEEKRSMFLTFSNGYPFSRLEILEFFTSRWGNVVDDVLIERTPLGIEPQYGRIIFTSTSTISRILNGESKAKFVVNRKHLWARVYVPRRRGTEHN